MDDIITGGDGVARCGWCGHDPLYQQYHDSEWGYLALDNAKQFEFLVLESAQAGLSWLLILKKRQAYCEAYCDFNPERVSEWGEADVIRLLENKGIIRNRRKIEASIANARAFLNLCERFDSFGNWLMKFFDDGPIVNYWERMEDVPAHTDLSTLIAKEMKSVGFSFFGPTVVYAHLQATGLVDDHLLKCWRRNPH